MKKYLIILIVVLSTFFVGCKDENNELLDKGKAALESKQYNEAIEYLSDYLHDEPKDEDARSMYKQAVNMKKALEYKNKEYYKDALEHLELIVNLESGSKSAKVDSKNLKKEIESLNEEAETEELLRKEGAKRAAKQAVRETESNYYAWRQNRHKYEYDSDEESSILDNIIGIVDKLLE